MQNYITSQMNRGDVETQFLSDMENDYYQLTHIGWENGSRAYGSIPSRVRAYGGMLRASHMHFGSASYYYLYLTIVL